MMKKLNKNTLMIIVGVLAVVLVVLVVVVLNPFGKKLSQEEKLKEKIETMGAEFYENLYYKQVETLGDEKEDFLKKFEKIGIKVDLGNLSRYKGEDSEEILKEFVNKKTDTACDKNKTQAIIYPQAPYDKKSYKIEVNLDCGFKKDEENKKTESTKTPDSTNDVKKEDKEEK